jgi:phage-related protein
VETFTWEVDRQPQRNKAPDVKVLKFGDSYESRIKNGLARAPQKWSVSFSNRSISDIDAIDAFLDDRDGSEAFLWTPPNQVTAIVVVARSWDRSDLNSQLGTITTVFEQVFEV